ncbi:MAG: hypothetical protein HZB11_02960 [Candidatus Yonathbacteria bacterium]|nr:hypothetical protein [Candidatus Yonathbacteria bacterium]
MATLSIFANFYVNDEERFLRMKDSFLSFKDIEAQKWVINIRGEFKEDAMIFLRSNLKQKLISYALDSKEGWFDDTKQMIDIIDTDFILFWVEDHVNQVDVTRYKEIISEMKSTGAEYLTHSWWFSGRPLEIYRDVKKKESKNIFSFILDQEANHRINEKYSAYIISMLGIFATSLFKKIIKRGAPVLRSYPKKTPLDFEKGAEEVQWLPIHYAIPKYELFASIDDGGEGYSLQSRDLYSKRVLRPVASTVEIPHWKLAFRTGIREYIPVFIYKKLIRVVIFYNKVARYVTLLIKGL